MSRHTHFIVGGTAHRYDPDKTAKLYACGKDDFLEYSTEKPNDITCPVCSAKWAKMQPEFSRITLSKTDKPWGRSTYKVEIDGVHYGYVVCKTGRYSNWKRSDYHGSPLEKETRTSATGRPYSIEFSGFHSKEQAALAMLEVKGTFIKSKPEYDRESEEANRRWREASRKADERKAQRIADNAFAIENLKVMLTKAGLSNAEVVSLNTALVALGDVQELEGVE